MARSFVRFLLAGITLLPFTAPAAAQVRTALDTFPAGTHLRFREGDNWVKARLVSASCDSITFAREADSTAVTSMPMAALDQLQYGKGRNTKLGLGMAIGGVVGAGLGIASAVAVANIGFGSTSSAPASSYVVMAAVPALGGMLVGAGISALAAGEKWHPVTQPAKVTPIVQPTPRGFVAGVSFRF